MIFNRSSVYAALLILAVGIIGCVLAGNERAQDACQKSQSADTCAYIFR